MKTYAIINIHEIDFKTNIIEKLEKDSSIYTFTASDDNNSTENCIIIPPDIRDSQSKIKNFVLKSLFDMNIRGYVHVIEDTVQIYSDPTTFIHEIERMMDVFDLESWFNTVTDMVNYTFKRYNPRFFVDIDEKNVKSIYEKRVNWCSNANTSWICYNFDKASYDDLKFDDNFKIPMYYIIKFLAERRNNKKHGSLHYMNFYPSIHDELHVFKTIDCNPLKGLNYTNTQEDFQREQMLFNNMNINHQADMNIEMILDDIYAKLMSKVN